jgi:hypothetical protein
MGVNLINQLKIYNMKKHILLVLALSTTIIALPQSGNKPVRTFGIENTAEKTAKRFASINNAVEVKPNSNSIAQTVITVEEEPEQSFKTSNTSTLVSTWKTVSGSMNVYGVVVENSKPLQYNEDLNAVSFVHRKSIYYQPAAVLSSTTAESGVLVAMISQNWGNSWDSTCIWADNNNWARYPQGGIYNPLGGNDINSAYIVATGPITQANSAGWTGNYFASKQLGAANNNNSISAVPNAQQFLPSISPSLGSGRTDFARLDFQSLDNGKLVALGSINQDVNGTQATQGYRGARVITGSFTSGVFTWTGDSVIPVVTSGLGSPHLIAAPSMAWSEDGSVGYVVHIGASPSTTSNNVGFQPIVWKSVNGSPWAKVTSIDFNSPAMSPVISRVLSPNTDPSVAIPFFDFSMGIGTTVDKDNKLHIAACIRGTASSDPDSLAFTSRFLNADGERYTYPHIPGFRPYLYDFIGDGVSPWSVVTVDSLSSEGPGTQPTDDGFESNPWDATGGTANTDRVQCDARIQLSRTPDGKYVIYTFAESDTAATSKPTGNKWNQVPNVKARMMDVSTQAVHPQEINVTKPANKPSDTYTNIVTNNSVKNRAFFHYTSPKCALTNTVIPVCGPVFYLPMTVTSNALSLGSLQQLSPVVHRYISAVLDFGYLCTGISENSIASATNSYMYPNPARSNTTLVIDLKNNANVEVTLTNMAGQTLKSTKTVAYTGTNTIDVDASGLAKGIYMVNVKVDGASSTKKLIVE